MKFQLDRSQDTDHGLVTSSASTSTLSPSLDSWFNEPSRSQPWNALQSVRHYAPNTRTTHQHQHPAKQTDAASTTYPTTVYTTHQRQSRGQQTNGEQRQSFSSSATPTQPSQVIQEPSRYSGDLVLPPLPQQQQHQHQRHPRHHRHHQQVQGVVPRSSRNGKGREHYLYGHTPITTPTLTRSPPSSTSMITTVTITPHTSIATSAIPPSLALPAASHPLWHQYHYPNHHYDVRETGAQFS